MRMPFARPCRSRPGTAEVSGLNTRPNIVDPDGFYEDLLAAHEGLSDEESEALNARLVLVLANHIGDRAILEEALAAAALVDVEPTKPEA